MKKLIPAVLLIGLLAVGVQARPGGFGINSGFQMDFSKAIPTTGIHAAIPFGMEFYGPLAELVEMETRFNWGIPVGVPSTLLHSIYFSWGVSFFFWPLTNQLNACFKLGVSSLWRVDIGNPKAMNGFNIDDFPFDLHIGPYMGFGGEIKLHPNIWIKADIRGELFLTFTPNPVEGGFGVYIGPAFRF